MSCCDNPKERECGRQVVCDNCFSLLDDLILEETLTMRDFKNRNRSRKFEDLVCRSKLPPDVRYSLIELYPKMESHFFNTSRVNFVNLSQLAREMLIVCGFREYVEDFKPLKTKIRATQIKRFVEDAVLYGFGPPKAGCSVGIDLIALDSDFTCEPKAISGGIFSDRFLKGNSIVDGCTLRISKEKASSKTSDTTATKTKIKIKRRVL
jgi:hypothetical protein